MSLSQNAEIVVALSGLQSQLLKRVDYQLSIHGISFTEFLVMHNLNKAPKKTMRRIELAESIGLSASGVTRLLLPMEKIGLVGKEANPRDARVSLVKITKAGAKIYKESEASFNQTTESLISPLTDSQQNKFIDIIRILRL